MSTGTSLPTHGLPRQQQMAAEAINTLMGTKGTPGARALRVDDLVNLGLVRLDSSGNLHKTELFEQLIQSQQITVDPDAVVELQEKAVTFEKLLSLRDMDMADLRVRLQLSLANNDLLIARLRGEQKNFEDLTARVAKNEALGELLRQNTEQVHASIGALLEGVGSVDNVPHGEEYGRPSNLDLIDYYDGIVDTRRIGLRVPGSTQRIGDQRNLPQSLTTSFGAVRTVGALTADSTGAVSVNAHDVRYGAVSVHYNAVSNAVTGLTVDTHYVIYCYDGDHEGGTRTWFAGVDPSTVMNLGDDVVVAGEITIPASGSSSGGAGGSGDPADWCVEYDSVLPDGRLVRELRVGDMIPCWNEDPVDPQVEMREVLAIGEGEEECYQLVTEAFFSVRQSRSTPMTLQDGRVVTTDNMLGHMVVVFNNGKLRWDRVVDIRYLGRQRVIKLNVGDKMFFAGIIPEATIATHNMRYKP